MPSGWQNTLEALLTPTGLLDGIANLSGRPLFFALVWGLCLVFLGGRLRVVSLGLGAVFFGVLGGYSLAGLMFVAWQYVVPITTLLLLLLAILVPAYLLDTAFVVWMALLGAALLGPFVPEGLAIGPFVLGVAVGLAAVFLVPRIGEVLAPALWGTTLVNGSVGSVFGISMVGLVKEGYRTQPAIYVVLSVGLILFGIIVHTLGTDEP